MEIGCGTLLRVASARSGFGDYAHVGRRSKDEGDRRSCRRQLSVFVKWTSYWDFFSFFFFCAFESGSGHSDFVEGSRSVLVAHAYLSY